MAKWSVAEIMYEASYCHISYLPLRNIQIGLCIPDYLNLLLSQVGHSYAVFKSSMTPRREYLEAETELLQIL